MPATPPRDSGYTVAEAAEVMGVCTKTIRRWITDGTLPAYRVGPRLIRIRPEDLNKTGSRITNGVRA